MPNNNRPFSLVPMIFGDLEKEFEQFMPKGFDTSSMEVGVWAPKVDIIEEDKQFLVKLDIPGVQPKDIEININKNVLTIKGERETEHKEKKENYVRYERSKGSFYRRIILPEMVENEKITAKSDNGVLVITIPKADKGASRKIKVE